MRQIICVCIILMLGLLAACGNVVADTGVVAKSDLARRTRSSHSRRQHTQPPGWQQRLRL